MSSSESSQIKKLNIAKKKSESVDTMLQNLLNLNRKEVIKYGMCAMCKKSAHEFNDEISIKEYRISGLCQSCQDTIFNL